MTSSTSLAQCPPADLPEVAVIGRSNVGKSSMINSLTGRKSLALVSKTPGKTQTINHFSVDGRWWLVDLPGYGYARAAKSATVGWSAFTQDYILERPSLLALLLLVDASIPPLEVDLAAASWLHENEVPWALVFTKFDKRKKGVPPARENASLFARSLQARQVDVPTVFHTSSKDGTGKAELLAALSIWRDEAAARRAVEEGPRLAARARDEAVAEGLAVD